jgi:hypothetical protein
MYEQYNYFNTEQLNILTCFAVLTFTNYFIVPSASAVEHGDHSSW